MKFHSGSIFLTYWDFFVCGSLLSFVLLLFLLPLITLYYVFFLRLWNISHLEILANKTSFQTSKKTFIFFVNLEIFSLLVSLSPHSMDMKNSPFGDCCGVKKKERCKNLWYEFSLFMHLRKLLFLHMTKCKYCEDWTFSFSI